VYDIKTPQLGLSSLTESSILDQSSVKDLVCLEASDDKITDVKIVVLFDGTRAHNSLHSLHHRSELWVGAHWLQVELRGADVPGQLGGQSRAHWEAERGWHQGAQLFMEPTATLGTSRNYFL
jgi:hypothetical protein